MFVVRPIVAEDIEAIHHFAIAASLGIANLPAHMPRLKKMIDDGVNSFNKKITVPGSEIYPFILENTETGEKVGTCSLLASAGERTPFCTFYLENIPEGELEPLEGCNHTLLYPKHYSKGASELIALYLAPAFRKGGLGKLLSFSRFFFIAANRERFNDSLFADMRGYSTADNQCPFWDAIGGKIWKWSYKEVLKKLDEEEVNVCNLVTRYPIHWCLLTPEAQRCAGKIHPNTQAAYYMLNHQGLCFQREVSILDGGPIIMSQMDAIKCITHSKIATVSKILGTLETHSEVLLCNENPFRVCHTTIQIEDSGNGDLIHVDAPTAKALKLDVGTQVRYYI
ncbi:MAG: arginine N-succinyltransferase [Parachlamydiales bacterium]|jgi:arginine N-succinyltransferase